MNTKTARMIRRTGPALAIALAGALTPTAASTSLAQEPVRVTSPDGSTVVTIETQRDTIVDGQVVVQTGLFYSLEREGRKVMLPSRLGFEFRGAPALRDGLEITATERAEVDQLWEQPWGELKYVRDYHNELRVSVADAPAARPATLALPSGHAYS